MGCARHRCFLCSVALSNDGVTVVNDSARSLCAFRRWGNRADMIVVMFDAHKLDISDELEQAIDVLKPHNKKIR